MARLFNPRGDVWTEHFRWSGSKQAGKTPVGRATTQVLCIIRMDTVLLSRSLMEEGVEF
jgi:hypothetical protein